MEERLPPAGTEEGGGGATLPDPRPEGAGGDEGGSLAFAEDSSAAAVLPRIRRISVAAYVAFAIFTAISGGFAGLAGLTCSALVVMINFLWLEQIVSSILQPAPRLKPWKLTLRMAARFLLLGAAISVSIYAARFNALSVLLGFSIVVVGIIGEALYSTYRSFVSSDR